jgi:hypothetical protein
LEILIFGNKNKNCEKFKIDIHEKINNEPILPLFYRWVPVTKIVIKTFSMMIGNIKLPNFYVANFENAIIIHSIEEKKLKNNHQNKSKNNDNNKTNVDNNQSNINNKSKILYSLITEIHRITNCNMYLIKNPEYKQSEDIMNIKKNLDQEE